MSGLFLDAIPATTCLTYWLNPPTVAGYAGTSISPDRSGLQREVAYELRLAESSHPEELMYEPIEDWLFDPAEVPLYVSVLRGLLAAARALDATNDR